MEAVTAYQQKCQSLGINADDFIVRLLKADPTYLHLSGRAKVIQLVFFTFHHLICGPDAIIAASSACWALLCYWSSQHVFGK